MKWNNVKLTNKMLSTLDQALDILESDYSQEVGGINLQPYQKNMLKEIERVRNALSRNSVRELKRRMKNNEEV